jgi:nitroreductase
MDEIILPQPVFNKCTTVFEALKNRRTSRDIGGKPLSQQILADILWAAQGTNRKQGPFGDPGRTAGSASNSQEIRVYVVLKEGTYLYEPDRHTLAPVVDRDLRSLAIGEGQSPAGANAPVRLIYVADLDRFTTAGFQEPGLHDPEIQKSYYFVDTGLIAGNVYLAASSLGLSTWFHNCNKEVVAKELNLGPKQRALFGQTVGVEE